MTYASYALVKFKAGRASYLLLACHPEMLRAGVKAFCNDSAMKHDLKFLSKCFPCPRACSWVAVNEDGEFRSMDKRIVSSDAAKKIYLRCDDEMQHLHKYAPFKAKMASYGGTCRGLTNYCDWLSVETQADLVDLGITVTLEPVRKPMKARKL